jgi:hypothetical protein
MSQTHENIWSIKQQSIPSEQANPTSLQGKKVQDICTKVYNVRETILSDQMGQFHTPSRCRDKYVMVMVKIDGNAILVEPLKSQPDQELIHGYDSLIKWCQCDGITLMKHILNNKISTKNL